jgi:hypothetical protein
MSSDTITQALPAALAEFQVAGLAIIPCSLYMLHHDGYYNEGGSMSQKVNAVTT